MTIETCSCDGCDRLQADRTTCNLPLCIKTNLGSIVDMILHDNQLTFRDVSVTFTSNNIVQLNMLANRIPKDKLEDFAIGEESVINSIVKRYEVQELQDFFNKWF